MTNEEKFHDTVSILVKAYLNDQLEHRVCTACAVGNLVAHALGTKPAINAKQAFTVHDNYYYENGKRMEWWNNEIGNHSPTRQSELTGYTIAQLNRIEYAFEYAEGRPYECRLAVGDTTNPEWMFNGLMAVVDVLAEIHGIHLTQKEQAKKLFIKA